MAPEYYEHVRMRDILQKDLKAVEAVMETINAQRRLMLNTVAFRSTYTALSALDTAIVKLSVVEIELQQEINRHTQGITEAVAV